MLRGVLRCVLCGLMLAYCNQAPFLPCPPLLPAALCVCAAPHCRWCTGLRGGCGGEWGYGSGAARE